MATLVKKKTLPINTKQSSTQQISAKQTAGNWLNRLLAPQKRTLQLALLCAVLSVLLFVLQSGLLAALFSQLMQLSMDDPASLSTAILQPYLPWLLLCLLLRPVLHYGREQLSHHASHTLRHQLRQTLLTRLAEAGPNRRQLASDGALSSKLLEQTDALDGYISRYYVQRYLVVLSPLILVIATWYYSPLAAVLLLITAPLVPVFMILLGHAASTASRRQWQAMSRLSGHFLDLVRGMKTLQHLCATDIAQQQIAHSSEQYRHKTMGVLRLAFLSAAVLELFASLAIALVALYLGLGLLGILPWAKGEIPVAYPGALFILLLAPEFYAPLRQLGSDYHAKAEAEAAVTELQPLLQNRFWQHPGTAPIALLSAPALNLQQVSIAGDNGRQRLAPLSIQISAGERIALQGPSGCGKSSLLEALLGFTAYQGNILINQQPLSQLNRSDWHQQLVYLAQQPAIKSGTIAENLRLAKSDATDQQLTAVLQQTGLWPLISQLPQQLHTHLGERGAGLSGGQLQRLALAQLLLRQAPLWLLDEPTEHLDPDTASHIHQLLEQLSRGKTVIIVSHQPHNLPWLDRIITLPAPGSHAQEPSHDPAD